MKKPLNRAAHSIPTHPVLAQIAKEAGQMKLAQDLLYIHKKFIEKLDSVHEAINKKVGPEGKRGLKGDTPRKGVDYFTPDEIRAFADHLRALIPIPKNGADGIDGTNGIDGETPKRGVHYMHKEDIEFITKKVSGKIKQPKIDLEEVVSHFLNLPPGKRLKVEHIDGIQEHMANLARSFNSNQRPYIHGGGDTVQAGANITLTRTAAGKTIIASTGGSGSGFQQPTSGAVDGSNQTFVWATAPSVIVVDQGRPMQQVSSDGTINWTGTTTTVLSVAPNFDIFAVA